MVQITSSIQGFDQAVRALDALPDKFQKRAIMPMLRRSTRPMIRSARSRLLAYGSAYKKLAKSIGNITAKSRNAIIYVGPRIKGKWGAIGYIAHWVEYGTSGLKGKSSGTRSWARTEKNVQYGSWVGGIAKGGRYRADQPPKPFMRPAIDAEKNNVGKLVTQNFRDHLQTQINRLLKKV
jgi:hypothetical protein